MVRKKVEQNQTSKLEANARRRLRKIPSGASTFRCEGNAFLTKFSSWHSAQNPPAFRPTRIKLLSPTRIPWLTWHLRAGHPPNTPRTRVTCHMAQKINTIVDLLKDKLTNIANRSTTKKSTHELHTHWYLRAKPALDHCVYSHKAVCMSVGVAYLSALSSEIATQDSRTTLIILSCDCGSDFPGRDTLWTDQYFLYL